MMLLSFMAEAGEPNVSVGTTVAIVSIVVSVLFSIITMLAKSSMNASAAKMEQMDARLHAEEKATIRQDGEIKLAQRDHSNLSSDVSELKETLEELVTKREFEKGMENVEKTLERIERNVAKPGTTSPRAPYPHPSGGYSSVRSQSSDPPKKGT